MFSKIENVFSGDDLKKWFARKLDIKEEQKLHQVCDALIDHKLLQPANGYVPFKEDVKALYRFPVEILNPGANNFKKWTQPPRNALIVSTELVTKINDALKELKVESIMQDDTFSLEKIANSNTFTKFCDATCELQVVKLTGLDRKEKIAFFVNIYQVIYAHKMIKDSQTQSATKNGGMFSKLRSSIGYFDILNCFLFIF